MAADVSHKSWFGHPAGLSTLFFTEMWERLSYYGMRALLILYMVAPPEKGGLGFDVVKAGAIYGWYTGLVYAFGLPGGILADKWLGQFNAVLAGGVIIALGHFCLAFHALPFFYTGLGLIIVGTGLLKPNITTLVGALYEPGDRRRDGGFSLYYMGINVGAALAPFVCGTLGQKVSWHWGFGAAGIGMVLGIIQYLAGRHRLRPALDRIRTRKAEPQGIPENIPLTNPPEPPSAKLTAGEWKRIGVIVILFAFSALFWAAFEQAGSSLNLFADQNTRLTLFGMKIESTWFQFLNPFYIIVLAPVFSWLWVALASREPSSPAKFVLALFLVGFGFLLLVPASAYSQAHGARVSPSWLVGVYLLHTMGELCLSPVGLSMVSKLAPHRIVGSIMGFWFLTNAAGNYLAGWVAGFFESLPLPQLFGRVFFVTASAGLILWFLVRPLKKMMGDVK